jgi:hypothetical protein
MRDVSIRESGGSTAPPGLEGRVFVPESRIARAGKPPMKKPWLAILYLVAAGLVALWMWAGLDPVVPK